MKVMVADQEAGIFLSFKEWGKVKESLGDFSDWMDQQAEPSVFDMTDKELSEHLQPTAEALVKRALANGNYFSIQGSQPDQFIHEFADGSQELVTIDGQTGKSEATKVRR